MQFMQHKLHFVQKMKRLRMFSYTIRDNKNYKVLWEIYMYKIMKAVLW